MTALTDVVAEIRSKNAGPFALTVDVFCGSPDAYQRVRTALATEAVASAFRTDPRTVRRFEIDELHVVKFSLPRPHVQGTRGDRDMHGAAYANLLGQLEV